MVSERDDDPLVAEVFDDQVVGESAKNQPFRRSEGRNAWYRDERREIRGKEVKGIFDHALEIGTEPFPLSFIPSRSLKRFLRSQFAHSNFSHASYQSLPSRSRILRENSSRSMSLAVPASTSSNLRTISSSHSRDASESIGPSRLRTRSLASSARSAFGRSRASLLSRSIVCRAMIFSFQIDSGDPSPLATSAAADCYPRP